MKKMARWVFTLPVEIVTSPQTSEEDARKLVANLLRKTPNDYSQQARLEKIVPIEVA